MNRRDPPRGLCEAWGISPRLERRARESDLAFAAIIQRDAALAEVEALRGINAALEGENRRAWAWVRKLAAEGGA